MRWVGMLLFMGAVAACSGQASSPTEQSAPPATREASAAPIRFEGIGVACNASYQLICGDVGCQAQDAALPVPVPVAFSFDGDTGEGDLCVATGCTPVSLAALPYAPRQSGPDFMGGVVSRGSAAGQGEAPESLGVVSLALDGSAFQYVQSHRASVMIWGGACEPMARPGEE